MQDRVHRFLVAVDDLQDALGQARFLGQFRQHQRHGGVTLGWLEDEGVAAGDGRGEHPHRDHRGEVEGRDARRHAKRLTHGIHVDAGACAVGIFAFEQFGRADAVFHNLKPALHVACGVRQGLAVFAAESFRQFVHVTVEQGHELHQHPRATLRVRRGPAGLCCLRVFDCFANFVGAGERAFRLHFARGRVHHIGEASGGALDVFAVQIMGEFLHGGLLCKFCAG